VASRTNWNEKYTGARARPSRTAAHWPCVPSICVPRSSAVGGGSGGLLTNGSVYARDAKGLIVEGVRKRDIAAAADVRPIGGRYARKGAQILYRGKALARTGTVDVDTARGVHSDVLIDAQGHMLLGMRYRRLIGVDAEACVSSIRTLLSTTGMSMHWSGTDSGVSTAWTAQASRSMARGRRTMPRAYCASTRKRASGSASAARVMQASQTEQAGVRKQGALCAGLIDAKAAYACSSGQVLQRPFCATTRTA